MLKLALAAPCTFSTTPIIDLSEDNITLIRGESYAGFTTLGNTVQSTLKVSAIDDHPITFENNQWNLTTNTNADRLRYLFFAVSNEGCTATRLLTINVLHPPTIQAINPTASSITLQEGFGITFQVNSSNQGFWTLNNRQVSTTKTYAYRANYSSAGNYVVNYTAQNNLGLKSSRHWNLTVTNVNRPPLLLARIRGIAVPINGTASANLSHYFIDPDGTRLNYSYILEHPSEQSSIAKGQASVTVNGPIIELEGITAGTFYLTFIATDRQGATATSDAVKFEVIDVIYQKVQVYCGDNICLAPENCETCGEDCGSCKACVPKWDCTEWNLCSVEGYQYRTCIVLNACENMTEPPLVQSCDYNPTCTDGIQNGLEVGVDCGGSCKACPTCFDGIKNQKEERVDCGGPCDACATCSDGILNQNESDVDCGGVCNVCGENDKCNSNLDCDSKSCLDGRCTAPSCFDEVLNQREDDVDCGGPCTACPTCFDTIQNQGEERVDCGGPCISCPTCYDYIQNQDETAVDCGGSCRECTLADHMGTIRVWAFWSLGIFFVLMIAYMVRVIVTSRLIFLVQHNKTIYFFHEDEPTFLILFWWNRFFRYLRFDRHKDFQEKIEKTYAELSQMRRLPNDQLRPAMIQSLRELYAKILGLPHNFEYDIFMPSIRRSNLSFIAKVVILKNSKILYLIEKTKLYGDAGFALEDVLRAMEYLRKVF